MVMNPVQRRVWCPMPMSLASGGGRRKKREFKNSFSYSAEDLVPKNVKMKINQRVGEIAQWVKSQPHKPGNPSLTPRTGLKVEQVPPRCPLTCPSMAASVSPPPQIHTHIMHTIIKI